MFSRKAITKLHATVIVFVVVALVLGSYYYVVVSVLPPSSNPIPAEFVINDLSISGVEARVGTPINLWVKVSNVGQKTGSYAVPLLINGLTEQNKTITLTGGESKTVEFTVVKEKEGIYFANVGDFTKNFSLFTITFQPRDLPPPLTVNLSNKIDEKGTVLDDITIVSSDGFAALIIPSGTKAVDGEGKPLRSITIEPVTSLSIRGGMDFYENEFGDQYQDPYINPLMAVSYHFIPKIVTFNPAITFVMKYNETYVEALSIEHVFEKHLKMMNINIVKMTWVDLEGTLDDQDNTLVTLIDGFQNTYAFIGYWFDICKNCDR